MVGAITCDIWSKKGNRIRDRFLMRCSSSEILLCLYDVLGYDEGIVIGLLPLLNGLCVRCLKVTQYRPRDILGGKLINRSKE